MLWPKATSVFFDSELQRELAASSDDVEWESNEKPSKYVPCLTYVSVRIILSTMH